jgi:lipopolysaccharide biosynthesis regulator YciM
LVGRCNAIHNPQILAPVNGFTIRDLHHLRACHGWIELGSYREAQAEWLNIAPDAREHPDGLKALLHILTHEQQWDVARDVAEALVKLKPDEATSWLSLSYATRRATGGTVEAAWKVLFLVAEKFKTVPNVTYNLACLECQRGRRKEAWDFLEKAFDLSADPKELKLMALDEADLEPLWRDIAEI